MTTEGTHAGSVPESLRKNPDIRAGENPPGSVLDWMGGLSISKET